MTESASPVIRPILFSVPMARALVDGRKTQSRRIVKPQPYDHGRGRWQYKGSEWGIDRIPIGPGLRSPLDFCKYQVGDWLWVREAWRGFKEETRSACQYKASTAPDEWADKNLGKWRHAMFMPRWASRLTLEIINVKIERLREISEADARAESFESEDAFHDYWFELHPIKEPCYQGDAQDNQWVWALTFRVHEQNVNDMLRNREVA